MHDQPPPPLRPSSAPPRRAAEARQQLARDDSSSVVITKTLHFFFYKYTQNGHVLQLLDSTTCIRQGVWDDEFFVFLHPISHSDAPKCVQVTLPLDDPQSLMLGLEMESDVETCAFFSHSHYILHRVIAALVWLLCP